MKKQLFSLGLYDSLFSHSSLQFAQYLLSSHYAFTVPKFAEVL